MDIGRVGGIIYRYWKPTLRDGMRLMDMFYWPLLDMVLWGFNSLWLGAISANLQATTIMLSALALWQVVFRASIEVTRSLLDEVWHQNFTNLFASPLKLSEWIVAIMVISAVSALWNLLFGSLIAYVIFDVNIFVLGISLLPFFLVLVLFGWFCGFLSSSLILMYGRRVEMFAWTFPWLFAAFSCVFYPASVLPPAVQHVSWSLPTTYIFESARMLITTGETSTRLILIGLVLSMVFLGGGVLMFLAAFGRAKNRGLNSLI